MALIICPECKNKISQYSETCQFCGFPLKKILTKQNITDLSKTLICPKCGAYDYICEYTEDNSIRISCEYCHTFYLQTKYDANEFEYINLQEFEKGNEDFEADIAKQYGHGEFDQEAYNRRKEMIAQRVKEREMKKTQPQSYNQPKCPTCGSTNIKKITATQKASNAVLFGLFGNKRKKQFHCNNCGYEW